MMYTKDIIINESLPRVFEIMASIDQLKHWHDGLVSTEHISGTPREFGSVLKLNFGTGNSQIALIETVTKWNAPDEFHATYTTKGLRKIQENTFESLEDHKTRWICKNEFQPTTFYMRAMLFLMPRAYKKQTLSYMKNFKNLVEQNTSTGHDKT